MNLRKPEYFIQSIDLLYGWTMKIKSLKITIKNNEEIVFVYALGAEAIRTYPLSIRFTQSSNMPQNSFCATSHRLANDLPASLRTSLRDTNQAIPKIQTC